MKKNKEEKKIGRSTENTALANTEGRLAITMFEGTRIRRVFHNSEWLFSIVDVVEGLSESKTPRRYWAELKAKLIKEGNDGQLFDNIEQLKMPSADGKSYTTDTANMETVLRIIQSIRSPKAEPFKRWLAKVGYERIIEQADPEIPIRRAIDTYKRKGHSDDWIARRTQSIGVRNTLTGEWARRGIKDGQEYAVLTSVVQEGTFNIKKKAHMDLKGLQDGKDNLRDHMTNTELIFTMLGETATKDITTANDSQGFIENKQAATDGGKIAGDARHALEKQTGKRVVSRSNALRSKDNPKQLP